MVLKDTKNLIKTRLLGLKTFQNLVMGRKIAFLMQNGPIFMIL
jgi:hypothetical protein